MKASCVILTLCFLTIGSLSSTTVNKMFKNGEDFAYSYCDGIEPFIDILDATFGTDDGKVRRGKTNTVTVQGIVQAGHAVSKSSLTIKLNGTKVFGTNIPFTNTYEEGQEIEESKDIAIPFIAPEGDYTGILRLYEGDDVIGCYELNFHVYKKRD